MRSAESVPKQPACPAHAIRRLSNDVNVTMAIKTLLNFHQNSAGLLFILAKQATKRAFALKGRVGEETEAATAIILCALVAEAAINEIGEWFESNRQRPPFDVPHDLPHGFYNMELRVKWSLLPILLRQRTFDRAVEPWQSFDALIELRNYLVHLRRRSVPKHAANYLQVRAGGELNFDAAIWACETMSRMFQELTTLFNLPPVYQGLWVWTPAHSFPFGLSTPGDPWPEPAQHA